MTKTDEQAQLLAADVGPDDDLGTAPDAIDVKPDAQPVAEPQPDVKPDAGISQTVTTEPEPKAAEPTPPGPDEGQPEVKPDETLEDVKKARAYHQTKQQEETKLRKELQDDLAAMNADLQSVDPSKSFDVAEIESAPEQAPATSEQPVGGDYDEIDPKKLTSDITQNVIGALDARDQKLRQQRIDYAYKQEIAVVVPKFSAFVAKYNIPDDVVNDALKYSERFVNQAALGAPTKRAELAGDYIQREMANRAVSEQRKLATKANAEADDKKIESAAALANPASGPISPPAPMTPEAFNDKLADDFAPDDVFD